MLDFFTAVPGSPDRRPRTVCRSLTNFPCRLGIHRSGRVIFRGKPSISASNPRGVSSLEDDFLRPVFTDSNECWNPRKRAWKINKEVVKIQILIKDWSKSGRINGDKWKSLEELSGEVRARRPRNCGRARVPASGKIVPGLSLKNAPFFPLHSPLPRACSDGQTILRILPHYHNIV